jgi:DNA polymerase-3 subunit delta
MKIASHEADAFVSRPRPGIRGALFYGPDGGLAQERLNRLAQAIAGERAKLSEAKIALGPETLKEDPARLRDEMTAMNLFGDKRVVCVGNANDKLAPLLGAAFEAGSDHHFVLCEAGELSPSSALRRLFENAAWLAAIPCYHLSGRELEASLRAAFTRCSLTVAPDALAFMASQLGGDYGIVLREVEKIALYLGEEKKVDLATVRRLVENSAEDSMDALCFLIALKERKPAYAQLQRLLQEGAQPVALARGLMRHAQRMMTARAHLDQGMTAENALAQLKPSIHFKYKPQALQAVARLGMTEWKRAAARWLKLERELKSGTLPPALALGQAVLG